MGYKMLKKFILGLFIIGVCVVSFAENDLSGNKIYAYYFHGGFRCSTCYRLEQYSKEAIEANFKDEIAGGRLVFKPVNVEEKGNAHFVNDYQLFTKSLVISLVKDGKEIRFKTLTKIWEYAGNKQKFFDYVKDEVSSYLKEL